MTAKTVYHSGRAPSKKMFEHEKLITVLAGLLSILATLWAMFRFVITPLCRKHFQPRLKLIDSFSPGSQGYLGQETHLSIENSGWTAAKNIVVELSILKPLDIYLGYGLFFEKKIGRVEAEPIMESLLPTPNPLIYRYRLNPMSLLIPLPMIICILRG